jgi:hypothetical protein
LSELTVRDLVADRRDLALEGLADATSNRLVLRRLGKGLCFDVLGGLDVAYRLRPTRWRRKDVAGARSDAEAIGLERENAALRRPIPCDLNESAD